MRSSADKYEEIEALRIGLYQYEFLHCGVANSIDELTVKKLLETGNRAAGAFHLHCFICKLHMEAIGNAVEKVRTWEAQRSEGMAKVSYL